MCVQQAICRLFTLYISHSGCCKSLSVSVHDHLPPGWITSAFFSLFVLLDVYRTMNYCVDTLLLLQYGFFFFLLLSFRIVPYSF